MDGANDVRRGVFRQNGAIATSASHCRVPTDCCGRPDRVRSLATLGNGLYFLLFQDDLPRRVL